MPARITTEQVWKELEKQIFAVLGFVNAKSEARSAGIVYVVRDRKLFISTGSDSWKARHIENNPHVALTVPIHKRILFLPWVKIPAATITFAGVARVLPIDEVEPDVTARLFRGMDVDEEFVADHRMVEVTPVRDFVTYGVGVSLMTMRRPTDARGRAPVDG